ncbi:MAG TPA: IS66 family transposase [Pseudonocardiaceae bacterium]|nr:IS66 family transposase [Pseudonocardiaceae bacterium]
MSGSEQPSREELVALIEQQARLIAEQAARIDALQAEVTELNRRLGRTSRNSSQPPSADGPSAPMPRSPRRRSGRNPGKQPGAGGVALLRVENPDEVVEHVPQTCGGCGGGLADAAPVGVVRRQVHDIPTITPRVVEHRLHQRRCGCGQVTSAAAPNGVSAPAVYGPNLRALAAYLVVFQHLPVARAAQLIADLTGARPSTGWISSVLTTVADVLVDIERLITTLITLAHVIHVDETSSNINGARWWLHVACTDTLTAYHLHPSRGRAAVTEFGVLPAFAGTVVHDALSLYDAYPQARHALCGAHLARELVAAAEAHPDLDWPDQALRALYGLNSAARQAREQRQPQIPPEIAEPLLTSWRHAILVGLAEHRRRPGRKQSKTRNLLERLRDRDEQVLLFARDLSVPFTNNQAERDVRPTKTQMKISGCHRSADTARAWLRIRGYISTVRKHGADVLTALRDAITGTPWTPPQPA